MLNVFRALFCHTDGVTSGSSSFNSILCNQDLDNWPFVNFVKIDCPIPEMPITVECDLSKDQRQLLAYLKFISTG